jgi:hypothetical protein
MQLRDGITLNNLLYQILDGDPSVVRSSHARMSISPSAIREIPFEWDSEAITVCLDQMTGKDSLPPLLMQAEFTQDRDALHAAVAPALEEDAKGEVSEATRKHIDQVVSGFRARFLKNTSEFAPGYDDALSYFTTMASLSRLLADPSMKTFLGELEQNKDQTVGQLIAFMHSFNLRFGPATSARQIEVYSRLVPTLTAIRDEPAADHDQASPPDRSGEGLKSAARSAFQGMTWDQLEAHRKGK